MARANHGTHRSKVPAVRAIEHVAAYLRVSTDEQVRSGLGIEAQRAQVRAMATVKGWPQPTEYVEEGVSGTKALRSRPQMRQLLQAIAAGEVDALIVPALDRFARSSRIILEGVDLLAEHGVLFVSCRESFDTSTPSGQLVLTIFAAIAQMEREVIIARVKGALAQASVLTGDAGGRIPYGYLRSGEPGSGLVEVDSQQAALVRKIFNAHRRGESLRTIAKRLNDDDWEAPRGGVWRHTTVASILAHRALYSGGKRAQSAQRWPAILG